MRKAPVIIAGIGIVGAAYFGGIYMSGSKAISRLHQLVERANVSQSGVHFDIQDEHRGLFTSTAKITAANKQNYLAIEAPLSLHHGLFSTDIESQVAASMYGKNVLQSSDSHEDRFIVTAHVKHNDDGKGSSVSISAPGKLVLSRGKWIEGTKVVANRANDGRLTITISDDASQSTSDDITFSSKNDALTVSYDSSWVDEALPVIADNIKSDSPENQRRLGALFLSQLPDIHASYKELSASNGSGIDLKIDALAVDLARESKPSPLTHLTASIGTAEVMGKHYSGSLSVKLDQPVIDTLLGAKKADTLRVHNRDEELKQKVTALLQSSPRLTLESFNVSGDDLSPVSAEGYFTVNGADVKSSADVAVRDPKIFKGQLTINNVPAQAIAIADLVFFNGLLGDIKPGDNAQFVLSDGKVTLNGKSMF